MARKLRRLARFGTYFDTYVEIARDAHEAIPDINSHMVELYETADLCEQGSAEWDSAMEPAGVERHRLQKTGFLVIVFSAMALEAFIYDYAARYLGDNFVQRHLDKLDLCSKWICVPELTVSRQVPYDHKALAHLRTLVRDRNKLVHSKSKGFAPSGFPQHFHEAEEIDPSETYKDYPLAIHGPSHPDDPFPNVPFASNTDLVAAADNAIDAMNSLAALLDELDPNADASSQLQVRASI